VRKAKFGGTAQGIVRSLIEPKIDNVEPLVNLGRSVYRLKKGN